MGKPCVPSQWRGANVTDRDRTMRTWRSFIRKLRGNCARIFVLSDPENGLRSNKKIPRVAPLSACFQATVSPSRKSRRARCVIRLRDSQRHTQNPACLTDYRHVVANSQMAFENLRGRRRARQQISLLGIDGDWPHVQSPFKAFVHWKRKAFCSGRFRVEFARKLAPRIAALLLHHLCSSTRWPISEIYRRSRWIRFLITSGRHGFRKGSKVLKIEIFAGALRCSKSCAFDDGCLSNLQSETKARVRKTERRSRLEAR